MTELQPWACRRAIGSYWYHDMLRKAQHGKTCTFLFTRLPILKIYNNYTITHRFGKFLWVIPRLCRETPKVWQFLEYEKASWPWLIEAYCAPSGIFPDHQGKARRESAFKEFPRICRLQKESMLVREKPVPQGIKERLTACSAEYCKV